jgi:amidophosphoribosyltransferase
MAEILGADSLAFISIENLKAAIGVDGGFCDACFTGDYPTPTPAASTPVAISRREPVAAHQAALPGV